MTTPEESFNLPRFLLGARVYFADGRNGVVLDSDYNPNFREWQYAIEGIGAWFRESDLSLSPPEPVSEVPSFAPSGQAQTTTTGLTQTQVRQEIADALSFFQAGTVTEQTLSDAIEEAVNVANLTAQANNVTMRSEIDAEMLRLGGQFEDLESNLTATLTEISNRLEGFDEAVDADSGDSDGSGFLGFVGNVGSFLRNPLDWLIDRIGGQILDEVEDGLNR